MMHRFLHLVFALFMVTAIPSVSLCTDRFYADITTRSPLGRYQVEAASPDNVDPTRFRVFQRNFSYTCRDSYTNTLLWTRKQAMAEPELREDGSQSNYQSCIEESPIGLFASDDGWTVIYTGSHEFIVVDKQGRDRGKVRLISEGFTVGEREQYIHNTTAGPIWFGDDDYFFRNVGKDSLFVTRPPWGRSVIINLETGKLNDKNAYSSKVILADDPYWSWEDSRAGTRMVGYTLSLMLLPFVIGCGIWMQRRAAVRSRKRKTPMPSLEAAP